MSGRFRLCQWFTFWTIYYATRTCDRPCLYSWRIVVDVMHSEQFVADPNYDTFNCFRHVLRTKRLPHWWAMHEQDLCTALFLVRLDVPPRLCKGTVIHVVCKVVSCIHRCIYLLTQCQSACSSHVA